MLTLPPSLQDLLAQISTNSFLFGIPYQSLTLSQVLEVIKVKLIFVIDFTTYPFVLVALRLLLHIYYL